MTDVRIRRDVPATMRDGTVLRADVYQPDDEETHPVLVVRTPYSKDLLHVMAPILNPVQAAAAGYIVVMQDVRGRYTSDGSDFAPLRDEIADGHDTVEWAARLAGSNGRVGEYGVSYMAATTWLAAAGSPPALQAIAPAQAPGRWNDHLFWRRGGILELGAFARWAMWAIAPDNVVRDRDAAKRAADFADLIDLNDRFQEVARAAPLTDLPITDPGSVVYQSWAQDALVAPIERSEPGPGMPKTYESVQVPALIVAGWHDLLLHADLDHFAAIRSTGGTVRAREQSKLVIGPWWHGMFRSMAGAMDYGFRALGTLDLTGELDSPNFLGDLTWFELRWFDRWLKDAPNGVENDPRVRYFLMGANRWESAPEWPPPGGRETQVFLGAEGRLDYAQPSGDEPSDRFIYDPADPCPTAGGRLLITDMFPKGPVEQSALSRRPDVLTYTSEPLIDPVTVVGPISAVLYATSSASDTDFVVKLCDVHPDGRTFNVSDGIIRARYRDGRVSAPLHGEIVRYEIELDPTAMQFQCGHRLRVLVTSSDFPRFDRNPNTGELGVAATTFDRAEQEILHDSEHPSHLVLRTFP